MSFDADDLLALYAAGQFPMAADRESRTVSIIDPEIRGILPLENFHVPRRLARTVRQDKYSVTINRNFAATIGLCAESAPDRHDTWISHGIEYLCHVLHMRGAAHSVEVLDADGILVGGLYGVSLGGAFFGESMFSRARDASKVALVHLVARLHRQGFALLDTQFITAHLQQFGAVEIPRATYLEKLQNAIARDCDFAAGPDMTGAQALDYLQSSTQTS